MSERAMEALTKSAQSMDASRYVMSSSEEALRSSGRKPSVSESSVDIVCVYVCECVIEQQQVRINQVFVSDE